MKVLNLYAGLGGNRKLWLDVDVTAIETNEKIASVYKGQYPNDTVINADAHEYLLNHFEEYDYIWSSPPCQSHSRMVNATRHKKPRYVDLRLYEQIMFLNKYFNGKWVVENVKPFYIPLIEPSATVGRHHFWSNYDISGIQDVDRPSNFINMTNTAGAELMKDWLGINYEGNIYYDGNHCPAQVLRNCVHPLIGKAVMDAS